MTSSRPNLQALFAQYGSVRTLVLDAKFRRHLATRGHYSRHRVRLQEVREVHGGAPRYFLNTSPSGRAPIIIVGRTMVGRWLCVPAGPAGARGTWRAVTAYEANQHHIRRYQGQGA